LLFIVKCSRRWCKFRVWCREPEYVVLPDAPWYRQLCTQVCRCKYEKLFEKL